MGIVIAIVVAVIIVAAAAPWFTMNARRRRLQRRFGPEYERLAHEHDSRRKAEAELAGRERRVADLDIRPLSPDARAKYRAEWTVIQEQFVETPGEALTAATRIVTAVMRDRGYPTDSYDQILADLSVEHAHTLTQFRDAHEISVRADAGGASTEDMRRAMIDYRSLFRELVDLEADGLHRDVHQADVHQADARQADLQADDRRADGVDGYEAGLSRTGPDDVRVAGGRQAEDPAEDEVRAPAVTPADENAARTTVHDPAGQAEAQQRAPRR